MNSYKKVAAVSVAAMALVFCGVAAASGGVTASPARVAETSAAASVRPHSSPAVEDTSNKEAVFTPISPCRIVDTRLAVGPLGNTTTRTYNVGGTSGFVPQGGHNGGCSVPLNATAIAAIVTAVTPTNSGFLKAWPATTPEPAASVFNYPAHTTIGSGVTVAVQAGVAAALTVKNFGGPTQLLIDVTGYYQPQISADISADGSFFNRTTRVLSVLHTANTGVYQVTIDRYSESCSAQANALYTGWYASAITSSNHVVNVTTWHLVGGVVTDADLEFNFTVVC